jgi:hypothetical protein
MKLVLEIEIGPNGAKNYGDISRIMGITDKTALSNTDIPEAGEGWPLVEGCEFVGFARISE